MDHFGIPIGHIAKLANCMLSLFECLVTYIVLVHHNWKESGLVIILLIIFITNE
jgi:hypothetical protein